MNYVNNRDTLFKINALSQQVRELQSDISKLASYVAQGGGSSSFNKEVICKSNLILEGVNTPKDPRLNIIDPEFNVDTAFNLTYLAELNGIVYGYKGSPRGIYDLNTLTQLIPINYNEGYLSSSIYYNNSVYILYNNYSSNILYTINSDGTFQDPETGIKSFMKLSDGLYKNSSYKLNEETNEWEPLNWTNFQGNDNSFEILNNCVYYYMYRNNGLYKYNIETSETILINDIECIGMYNWIKYKNKLYCKDYDVNKWHSVDSNDNLEDWTPNIEGDFSLFIDSNKLMAYSKNGLYMYNDSIDKFDLEYGLQDVKNIYKISSKNLYFLIQYNDNSFKVLKYTQDDATSKTLSIVDCDLQYNITKQYLTINSDIQFTIENNINVKMSDAVKAIAALIRNNKFILSSKTLSPDDKNNLEKFLKLVE